MFLRFAGLLCRPNHRRSLWLYRCPAADSGPKTEPEPAVRPIVERLLRVDNPGFRYRGPCQRLAPLAWAQLVPDASGRG
jgi:hypothetical protein